MRKHYKNIKAIILTIHHDFCRSSLASRLPTALWPVMCKPAIEHLLYHLSFQGIKEVVVCSNRNPSLLQQLSHWNDNDRLKLKLLDEPLPMGTAGCIRKAAEDGDGQLFIVFAAAIVSPPDIDLLLQAHKDGKSHLTVFFNHGRDGGVKYVKAFLYSPCID